jgi:hypothetical protein
MDRYNQLKLRVLSCCASGGWFRPIEIAQQTNFPSLPVGLDVPQEAIAVRASGKAVVGQGHTAIPNKPSWIAAAEMASITAGLTSTSHLSGTPSRANETLKLSELVELSGAGSAEANLIETTAIETWRCDCFAPAALQAARHDQRREPRSCLLGLPILARAAVVGRPKTSVRIR